MIPLLFPWVQCNQTTDDKHRDNHRENAWNPIIRDDSSEYSDSNRESTGYHEKDADDAPQHYASRAFTVLLTALISTSRFL